MPSRTPRYEVVVDHIGIPCMTMSECRELAAQDATNSARIYKRTRNGYDDVTPSSPTPAAEEEQTSQTITNDTGDTLGTIAHLNNGGYIVYAPTCACGQYGGTFQNFREAVYWLDSSEVQRHGIIRPTKAQTIERASRIVARLRLTSLGIATGTLLALTLAHASAAPASCTPAGTTGEGFPVVSCADGSSYYLDMDGQPYANAAGAPVYCPGVVWIELP